MALDPIILQIIPNLPAVTADIDYEALRAQTQALLPMLIGPAGPVPVDSVNSDTVTGPDGPIPVRIYRPKSPVAGIMHFFHGGGWALGDIDIVDPVARRLARDLSMIVVTSSYRLAPENPFPAGFNDCLAAARWTRDRAAEIGGADLPLIIGGESAGANLAAAVALELTKDAERNFDAQLLFFPAVDLRPDSSERFASRIANADPFLRAETLPTLYKDYVAGNDPSDARISPLVAKDLTAAPPAVIAVLTVDPLRDEGVAYADRLREAGVRIELLEFDNLVHGFPGLAGLVPAAAEATTTVAEGLKKLLSI